MYMVSVWAEKYNSQTLLPKLLFLEQAEIVLVVSCPTLTSFNS